MAALLWAKKDFVLRVLARRPSDAPREFIYYLTAPCTPRSVSSSPRSRENAAAPEHCTPPPSPSSTARSAPPRPPIAPPHPLSSPALRHIAHLRKYQILHLAPRRPAPNSPACTTRSANPIFSTQYTHAYFIFLQRSHSLSQQRPEKPDSSNLGLSLAFISQHPSNELELFCGAV